MYNADAYFAAVFHREFVGFRALIGIRLRIGKARVDEAVHFNVRSHGGRREESAGNGGGDQSLFYGFKFISGQ